MSNKILKDKLENAQVLLSSDRTIISINRTLWLIYCITKSYSIIFFKDKGLRQYNETTGHWALKSNAFFLQDFSNFIQEDLMNLETGLVSTKISKNIVKNIDTIDTKSFWKKFFEWAQLSQSVFIDTLSENSIAFADNTILHLPTMKMITHDKEKPSIICLSGIPVKYKGLSPKPSTMDVLFLLCSNRVMVLTLFRCLLKILLFKNEKYNTGFCFYGKLEQRGLFIDFLSFILNGDVIVTTTEAWMKDQTSNDHLFSSVTIFTDPSLEDIKPATRAELERHILLGSKEKSKKSLFVFSVNTKPKWAESYLLYIPTIDVQILGKDILKYKQELFEESAQIVNWAMAFSEKQVESVINLRDDLNKYLTPQIFLPIKSPKELILPWFCTNVYHVQGLHVLLHLRQIARENTAYHSFLNYLENHGATSVKPGEFRDYLESMIEERFKNSGVFVGPVEGGVALINATLDKEFGKPFPVKSSLPDNLKQLNTFKISTFLVADEDLKVPKTFIWRD